MSTLSDHAFPMHLHLHPKCTTQSVLTLPGSQCSLSQVWAGAIVPFRRPRFSRAMVLNSGIPGSMVATLGFALVRVKMQLPTTACVATWPHRASTKGILISLHEASRQFCSHGLFLGKSLELRCTVFHHAVGNIAGIKVGFIVTFFIEGINSPSNNMNAFSWPLFQVVPGERGRSSPVRIMTGWPRNL